MTDHPRCEAVVVRRPSIVETFNPFGRDFAHRQKCGAPAVRDGLCARHLRLRDRMYV